MFNNILLLLLLFVTNVFAHSKRIKSIFYPCTVHFDIYKVHSPTNARFIKLDKVLKFTLKITLA